MAKIIETCKDVLRTRPVYEKREEEFYLRQKRKSELLKNSPQHQLRAEKLTPKAQNVFNAIQTIDNYSENYAEDMEKALGIGVEILSFMVAFPIIAINSLSAAKNPQKANIFLTLLSMMPMFVIPTIFAPFTAKKQIQASRTGRYQAIKNELSDVRNFVTYTPEQIEQAKNIQNDDKAKRKNNKAKNDFQNSFKILNDFRHDYAEYQKKKQTDNSLDLEFEEKLNGVYSEEQLQKAKEDRELVHNATKIINNKAEDYSENTENAYATLGMLGWIIAIPIGLGIGALASKIFKKVPPYAAKVSGMLGTSTFVLFLILTGTQRQKLASRVGRYVAEKEMKNDLSSVMYFDENEINSMDVENDYKKRGFFGKIFDNLTYLKKYNKDCKEYQNYKKTIGKEQKKLLENLKKVEVTPEQLKEAEELQKKVLFVFDELDEMSQSYSENVEAATDITYNTVSLLIECFTYFLPMLLAYKFTGRQFKLSKIFNKLSNTVFKNSSVIRKSANEINEIAKESKETRKKVDNILYSLFSDAKKNSVAPDVEIQRRISQPLENIMFKIRELKDNPAILKNEIKQNKFAQYVYNLVTDILKERPRLARNKAKRLGEKYEPKPPQNPIEVIQNALDDGKSEKMGKTLRNTLIIGSAPIVGVIFLVPFALQSWFTNMQKKAGKIGVMKALDNVNDVRYYT